MRLSARRSLIVSASLIILALTVYLGRDMLVGMLLEKHTLRTCAKLLGGDCSFADRNREGNTLTLKDITVGKKGLGSVYAKDLKVSWEYSWVPPFIAFDVIVHQLKGDAGILPLYGAWKAVRHASGRRGIRLTRWEFDGVSLQTPSGNISFPQLVLKGAEGLVQANAENFLDSKGELQISGGMAKLWNIRLSSLPIKELIKWVKYIDTDNAYSFLESLDGKITADASYTPSGLKGQMLIESLNYGSGQLQIAQTDWGIESDPSMKHWNIKGKTGPAPLFFTISYSAHESSPLKGKIWGTSVPLTDLFPLFNCSQGQWECGGTTDIEGEFDNRAIFAFFKPKNLTLGKGEIKLFLESDPSKSTPSAKVWVDYSKGIERMWIDLKQAKLVLGGKNEMALDAEIELRKNGLTARKLKACCETWEATGELLANTLPDGSVLLLAEEGKFHLGAWNIKNFQTLLDPHHRLSEIKIIGEADSTAIWEDLKKFGIDLKNEFDFLDAGNVTAEIMYHRSYPLRAKGKWKSDLLTAEAKMEGEFDNPHQLQIKSLEATLSLAGVGKIGKYALLTESPPSVVDFSRRTLEIYGKIKPGMNLPSREIKISGPWNQLAFEMVE